MERTEILKKITPLCREAFSNPELNVTENLDASMVEKWTSLSFMHLLSDIEKFFGFKFKVMEVLEINTIGDLVSTISSHI